MRPLTEIQELIKAETEKECRRLEANDPQNLYLPVEYIMRMSGKKLRPAMVLLSYNLFSDNIEQALPAAMAIEVFHNFTLLHDDIMDKSSLRRGNPTVHKKFGENAAILSGDVMAFISFRYLLKSKTTRMDGLLKLFTETAIQVCEGQQYDMDFENRPDVMEKEYLEMIRLKTAVLIACSFKSGALLAGAGAKTATALYNLGINMGMAFQLQDDLLDTFGDESSFGKKIGNDIVTNKKTYLLIKALELANPAQKKKLISWINKSDFSPDEKITTVKKIYRELGIESKTRDIISDYISKTENCLTDIPVAEEKKSELRKLLKTLSERVY